MSDRNNPEVDTGTEGRDLRRSVAGRRVRDALTHLYDIPYLQTHPLARMLIEGESVRADRRGWALQQRLTEAIEGLRPDRAGPVDPRVARRHELMSLRYVDAMDVPEVCRKLGVSQSEFYRELARGLEAIITALSLGAGPPAPAPAVPVPGNLPVPSTPLVDRERETSEAQRLLLDPAVRLLTLTGPGGMGKTRLALSVASAAAGHFPDGAWFVDLSPLAHAGLVPSALARVLGLQQEGGVDVLDVLKQHLRDREALLVFDNFEHLLPAGAAVSALLAAAPGLKVLATSRSRLRLGVERQYRVPPLPLPERSDASTEELTRYGAVALFLQRAAAIRPDFALTSENGAGVAEICRRLEGLPLAIELAAARTRLLPPRALLERLEPRLPLLAGGALDMPARHRALRATLDWSYDLLAASERGLVRRLSVFAGGCTLAAAESICIALGEQRMTVLDGLSALVDDSLLTQEDRGEREPRFHMLETVREYAMAKLHDSGEEDAVRTVHMQHFLELARLGDRQLRGPEQGEWLSALGEEEDNLRGALGFSESRPEPFALELAIALREFWWLRGRLTEGRGWVEKALERHPGAPVDLRARALYASGFLAYHQGDYIFAVDHLDQSALLFEQLGDVIGGADSLHVLANVAWRQGDDARSIALHRETLKTYQSSGDKRKIAASLNNLGLAVQRQGAYDEARSLFERSLALKREVGDDIGAARSLFNLGEIASFQGDYVRARRLVGDSLAIGLRLGDRRGIAIRLLELGNVARHLGDLTESVDHYRRSLELLIEIGDRSRVPDCLEGLAASLAQQEDERPAFLLGAASSLRRHLGVPATPQQTGECRALTASVQAYLGDEQFQAEHVRGEAMTLREILQTLA